MFENVKNNGVGKFISHGEWSHIDRIIDFYEIIFVTRGIVFINENGVEYEVRKDEIIFLEPNLRRFGYKKVPIQNFFGFIGKMVPHFLII